MYNGNFESWLRLMSVTLSFKLLDESDVEKKKFSNFSLPVNFSY